MNIFSTISTALLITASLLLVNDHCFAQNGNCKSTLNFKEYPTITVYKLECTKSLIGLDQLRDTLVTSEQIKHALLTLDNWLSTARAINQCKTLNPKLDEILQNLPHPAWSTQDFQYQIVPFSKVGELDLYIWVNALPKDENIISEDGIILPIGGGMTSFNVIVNTTLKQVTWIRLNGF